MVNPSKNFVFEPHRSSKHIQLQYIPNSLPISCVLPPYLCLFCRLLRLSQYIKVSQLVEMQYIFLGKNNVI